jgi:hypothetical protein
LIDLELPLTTPIADVIHIRTATETGPHRLVFNMRNPLRSLNSNVDEALILPHEALPMSLLGLIDRGRPRRGDGHVRLIAQSLTLESLSNANNYAKETLCIEGSRLIIHFCKS